MEYGRRLVAWLLRRDHAFLQQATETFRRIAQIEKPKGRGVGQRARPRSGRVAAAATLLSDPPAGGDVRGFGRTGRYGAHHPHQDRTTRHPPNG